MGLINMQIASAQASSLSQRARGCQESCEGRAQYLTEHRSGEAEACLRKLVRRVSAQPPWSTFSNLERLCTVFFVCLFEFHFTKVGC